MKLAVYNSQMIAAATLAVLSIALAACSFGGSSNEQKPSSSLVDTGQSQPTTPGATAAATRMPAATAEKIPGAATHQSGTPANIRVPTTEATVGNLTMTLSVAQARRMVVGAAAASGTSTPQSQQGQGGNQRQGGPAQQEMILGDQTQQVNKNLDPSQGPPPDPKDGQGDYIRNVTIQVKDNSTGQVVPYLIVSMDLLRDGRPVQYDQALLASVPQGESVEQLHYTNNVAFPGKGRYQLFVRIQPSPVLGNSAPPSTQFEVIIE